MLKYVKNISQQLLISLFTFLYPFRCRNISTCSWSECHVKAEQLQKVSLGSTVGQVRSASHGFVNSLHWHNSVMYNTKYVL